MIDWTQFLAGLFVGLVVGVLTGLALRFERVPAGPGHKAIIRPRLAIEKRWLTAILVAMFIISTAQVTWWTFHQRECNREFQRTSLELRRISGEDRDLERRDDDLKDQRDDAMTTLVDGLINPPPGERRDTSLLLNRYYETLKAIDVQRGQLRMKRANLEQERQEYNPPRDRC